MSRANLTGNLLRNELHNSIVMGVMLILKWERSRKIPGIDSSRNQSHVGEQISSEKFPTAGILFFICVKQSSLEFEENMKIFFNRNLML